MSTGKKRGPYKGRTEYAKARRDTNRDSERRIIDHQRHIRENVIIDPLTGCWVWQRAKNRLGYGFKHYNNKANQLVHRVAYMEFIGPIPDGMNVLHRCDNPPCCNPKHLFLGTKKDNTADMFAKGRANRQPAIQALQAWRERKFNRRLPILEEHEALDIKRMLAVGVPVQMAANLYGIGYHVVSQINTRKSWKHLIV